MPLNLHDLAPYLAPYQAIRPLDLSDAAAGIEHNIDREQVREIADQNDLTTRAGIAEDARQADQIARQKAAEEAARQAEVVHKRKTDAFAATPGAIHPVQEREIRGQLGMAGLSVSPEGQFSEDSFGAAPETQLQAPPDTLKAPAAPRVGLQAPTLEMGALPGQLAPTPTIEDRGEGVYDGDQRVGDFDPRGARHRAVEMLQHSVDENAKRSGQYDVRAARKVAAMAESVLAENGYDMTKATAALDALYRQDATQAHADARSQTSAMSGMNKFGTGRDDKWYLLGERDAETRLGKSGIYDHASAYKGLDAGIREMETDPGALSTARAMFLVAHSNNPLEKRMSDQDFRASQGGQSLEGMTENQLSEWFSGDKGETRRQQLLATLRARRVQMLNEAHKTYGGLARQRDTYGHPGARSGYDQKLAIYNDYGQDFFDALRGEDPNIPEPYAGEGGGMGGGSAGSVRTGGAAPDSGDDPNDNITNLLGGP